MEFQAVVLAGGLGKRMYPLTSGGAKHKPKAMLPVAGKALLSYPLEMCEKGGFLNVIVVVAGEDAAGTVRHWIQDEYTGVAKVEVICVAEDCGSAGAIRSVAARVRATNLLVLSGDVVSEVPLAAVATQHQKHGADATALVSRRRASARDVDSKSKKKPPPSSFIGLDSGCGRLLYYESGDDVSRELRMSRSLLRRVGTCTIRTDLLDAHVYIFRWARLREVLEDRPQMACLRGDVLPYLVRRQFSPPSSTPQITSSARVSCSSPADDKPVAAVAGAGGGAGEAMDNDGAAADEGAPEGLEGSGGPGSRAGSEAASSDEEARRTEQATGMEADMTHNLLVQMGRERRRADPGVAAGPASAGPASAGAWVAGGGGGGCYVHMAAEEDFTARVNTVPAFLDVNREVAGRPGLVGAEPSRFDNYVDPTAELGNKSTVGAACVVGGETRLGDKTSVKRSVIGPGCTVGSSCKVVNSVVMGRVTIEDGVHVQNSVVCAGATVRERATLKECTVGPAYVVGADEDIKGEVVATDPPPVAHQHRHGA